jgi:hypothetical protein
VFGGGLPASSLPASRRVYPPREGAGGVRALLPSPRSYGEKVASACWREPGEGAMHGPSPDLARLRLRSGDLSPHCGERESALAARSCDAFPRFYFQTAAVIHRPDLSSAPRLAGYFSVRFLFLLPPPKRGEWRAEVGATCLSARTVAGAWRLSARHPNQMGSGSFAAVLLTAPVRVFGRITKTPPVSELLAAGPCAGERGPLPPGG